MIDPAMARRQGDAGGPIPAVFPSGKVFDDGIWVNRVVSGDSLYLLSRVPDNAIGSIVSDPPFFTSIGRTQGAAGVGQDPWVDGVENSSAAVEWAQPYANQFKRVVRPGGAVVLMAGVHAVAAWMVACERAGLIWMAELTVLWNTGKPRVQNFGSLCTHVLWFTVPGARHTWNSDKRSIYSNVLVCDKISPVHKVHPAQKPVELTNFIIGLLTRQTDVVLDPFCGSGSTLVSAEMAGRAWLGFEGDKTHVKTARRRVQHWEVEEVGTLHLWVNNRLEKV